MAILGFPLIIPILLTLIKIGMQAIGLVAQDSLQSDIFTLVGIDLVLLAFSMLLFPFLWKD